MNMEYQILRYYFAFFGLYACKLQRRKRFLWWDYWVTVSDDKSGGMISEWVEHYKCPVIETEDKNER